MGTAQPKQFMLLDGVPVLQRSIGAFLKACPDIKVVTVLPKDHLQTWKDICTRTTFDIPQRLVEGGITRFHSVQNALETIPDGAIVAVHDGVRPLITPEFIHTMFSKMENCRSLIPVLPVVDTLKTLARGSDGELTCSIEPDPDRSVIFGAQTPQIFLSEDLRAAYTQPYDTAFTDDASVARKYGIPLSFILGERLNIKITSPEDLTLAESILLLGKLGRL